MITKLNETGQLLTQTCRAGLSAELLVVYRFLEAGRRPSLSLGPYPYDALIDSGDRIWRVQIKQAYHTIDGYWRVRLTRRRAKKDLPILAAELDYLVVVCTPDVIYVIPRAACLAVNAPDYLISRMEIRTTSQWMVFLNAFNIGAGIAPTELQTVSPAKRVWGTSSGFRRRNLHRKAHVGLSHETALAILKMPIEGYTLDRRPTVPIEQIAQQFGVSTPTIRNIMLRKRSDLREK